MTEDNMDPNSRPSSEDCLNCIYYEDGYCSYFSRYQSEVGPHDSCEHFYPAEICETG